MKWFLPLAVLLAIGIWVWPRPDPKPHRRLAPEGIFYVVEYVSVQTPHGVIGFEPGQEVRFLGATSRTLRVTDGKYQIDLTPGQLTNDLDIAVLVRQRDDESQRQLLAYQAAELAAYERSQREFNLQHSNRVDESNRQLLADRAVGNRYSKLDESSRWVRSHASGTSYGGIYTYLRPTSTDPKANGYNVNDWNR